MNVYIDESGIFRRTGETKNNPSCIGALVIPTIKKELAFRQFLELRKSWPGAANKELKGHSLNEAQIAQVVRLLIDNSALFEITAIDMEHHSDDVIEEYRKTTISSLEEGLSLKPDSVAKEETKAIIAKTVRLSKPLFVQAMIMMTVVPRTLRHGIIYYAHRHPSELGSFSWTVDAKEKNKLINYEEIWPLLNHIFLFSQSMRQPQFLPPGGDYSELDRYIGPVEETELVASFGFDPNQLEGMNLSMVLTDQLEFIDSKDNIGLQMVDILTTATRRALKGNLMIEGWGEIGRLILAEPADGDLWAIEPFALKSWDGKGDRTYVAENSANVYETYLNQARRLLGRRI